MSTVMGLLFYFRKKKLLKLLEEKDSSLLQIIKKEKIKYQFEFVSPLGRALSLFITKCSIKSKATHPSAFKDGPIQDQVNDIITNYIDRLEHECESILLESNSNKNKARVFHFYFSNEYFQCYTNLGITKIIHEISCSQIEKDLLKDINLLINTQAEFE